MVAQTHIGSSYNMMGLPFYESNFDDANGTLHTGLTTNFEWTAPARGSILGFSGALSDDLTTGTITIHATVNGSLLPAFDNSEAALLVPEHAYGYQMHEAQRTLFTFNAGDRIGAEYRASDDVEPETLDGAFQIVVLLEGVQY